MRTSSRSREPTPSSTPSKLLNLAQTYGSRNNELSMQMSQIVVTDSSANPPNQATTGKPTQKTRQSRKVIPHPDHFGQNLQIPKENESKVSLNTRHLIPNFKNFPTNSQKQLATAKSVSGLELAKHAQINLSQFTSHQ